MRQIKKITLHDGSTIEIDVCSARFFDAVRLFHGLGENDDVTDEQVALFVFNGVKQAVDSCEVA